MTTANATMVRVTHWPDSVLWPEGTSRDYSAFHTARHNYDHVRLNGDKSALKYRFYDPYSAYGDEELPVGQPKNGREIDNVHWIPSTKVLDRMIVDLEAIAKECPVLWWDSAIQCFPHVAQHLRRLFRLSILSFGDDLPGSSDVKTFPVARHFDVLLHAMYTWDFPNKKMVPEIYAEHGLSDCRFIAWGPMQPYEKDWFENKVQKLRDGTLPIDLLWIGGSGIAPHRQRSLQSILHAARDRYRMKFYGNRMRDGRWPGTAADLYEKSIFGLNIPESSFFNGRFADLFMSGTIQIAHDPCGEFARFGFVDGEHYLSYDGTGDGLIAIIDRYLNNREELVRIAIAGREKFLEYRASYDNAEVLAEVLSDYTKQIEGGR